MNGVRDKVGEEVGGNVYDVPDYAMLPTSTATNEGIYYNEPL